MVNVIKGALFLVSTVFLAGIIILVPEIADSTSVFYVMLIGSFLGFDILNMIKKTEVLPKGEYDKMKVWRYVLSILCLSALLVISFIKYKSSGEMKVTLGALSASVIIICGVVIAGLDGNKIATSKGGDQIAPVP